MSIDYTIFGEDGIDQGSRTQIENACQLPIARKAALMPDAHLGYGLPIGGVLGVKNAVIPYGVGVDIACRMRLTLTDANMSKVADVAQAKDADDLDKALEKGTKFGMGCAYQRSGRQNHDVMDHGDWRATQLLHEMKTTAWNQLGTSGSGNHFVEWGIVKLPQDTPMAPAGVFLGLLSHSGSRGTGAKVCHKYTKLAKQQNNAGELSWLDLGTEEGQEYWLSMQLMGEYAAANHEIIHRNVLKLAGLQAIGHVENHHNFAWVEEHDGEELIVHRKGATPAAVDELGVIPGSMASPAFIVRGLGHEPSVNSASHGAGRAMSRKEAKRQFTWEDWRPKLERVGVRLLAGGLDEVPDSYKDIYDVMAAQHQLIDVIGTFDPKIVMMCGDGSRPEDTQ